jgi:hypothetical protein
MLPLAIEADLVRVGDRFTVRFERTLRVPDDGTRYPLPPGLGRFEVHKVEDYRDAIPDSWRDTGGVFISMYQAEALWLSFDAAPWKPSAVTVAVGRVNAVSGTPWPDTLTASPQNYLVCPPQLWLDGINAGSGFVRQFVAMPLGRGATVEGQVTGVESHGGLQIRVYDPKPGRFPDVAPPDFRRAGRLGGPPMTLSTPSPMGFVPGGRIEQKVLEDEYGSETWDAERFGTLNVHVLNSAQYRAVTGREAPSSPVSARTYTKYGFPWFTLYEEQADVPAADAFASLTSIADLVESREQEDADRPLDISDDQLIDLERDDRGRASKKGE